MNAIANLIKQFRGTQAISDVRTDEEREIQIQLYANTIGRIQDKKEGSWKDKDNALFQEEVAMARKLYAEGDDEEVTFLEEIEEYYNTEKPGTGKARVDEILKAAGISY